MKMKTMMKSLGALGCVSCLLIASQSFAAVTLDFDAPSVPFQQGYGEGDLYSEDGFQFGTVNAPGHVGAMIRFNPPAQNVVVPDNGSIHLGISMFTTPYLQREDGGVFNLNSLSVGEYSQFAANASQLNISGTLAGGGSVSAVLSIDGIFDGAGGLDDFQSYDLNWENLVRVDFNSELVSIDNLQVEAIPEPVTVAFLLCAMGVFVVRRNVCLESRKGAGRLYMQLNTLFSKFYLNTASESRLR